MSPPASIGEYVEGGYNDVEHDENDKVPLEERRASDRLLWQDELVWVADAEDAARRSDPLPYVPFGPGCFYHPIAASARARANRTLHTVLESPALAGVQDAVAAGLGIAILDRSTAGRGAVELPDLNAAAPLPRVAHVTRAGGSVPAPLATAISAEINDELGETRRTGS